jgi:UDP-N-acetylglucosamine--N-acetylmuramyl-(pentapeptide) pyrophosphoryl-undecaprenol N-acetylglucosamine transferase
VNDALTLLFDPNRLNKLSENAGAMAKPNATEDIVNEIEKLIGAAEDSQDRKSQPYAMVIS